jgi:WD40 repeat protein
MPVPLRLPALLIAAMLFTYWLTMPGRTPPEAAAEDGATLPADPLPPGAIARLGTNRLRSAADTDRVAISPDAQLLVTTRDHYSLEVWDGRTGVLLRTIPMTQYKAEPRFRGDEDRLASEEVAAMAFAADTGRFHVLTDTGVLRHCDLTTGTWSEPLARATLPKTRDSWDRLGRWRGFASRDGTHFAFATPVERFDRELERLDVVAVGRDKPLLVLDRQQLAKWDVHGFGRDNNLVGVARQGATVTLNWNLAAGGPTTTLAAPGEKLRPLTVSRSPDGRAVAVVYAPPYRGRDDTINPRDAWPLVVYEVATGRERYRVMGWKGYLVGYAGDGTKFVASDRDTVVLADASTGRVTHRSKGHATEWLHCSLSADDRHLATCGGRDHSIIVWDLETGKPALDFDAPRGTVQTIVFSPDGQMVFTSTTKEHAGYLWDAETGRRKRRLVADGKGTPLTAAFTPDSQFLVASYGFAGASSTDGNWAVRLWRVSDGKLVREFRGHKDMVGELALSPGGGELATWDRRAAKVRLWELRTGRLTREIAWVEQYGALLAYPDDGELLGIATDRKGGCETRNLLSGKVVATWRVNGRGHGHAVSPDGRLLAAREEGQPFGERVIVRRAATGENLCELPLEHVSHLSAIAFSHDGALVAVAGVGYSYYGEDTVYLFDTTTGKQVRTIRGHRGQIRALAFSPDGKRLATGSWDTTVLIWDLTANN